MGLTFFKNNKPDTRMIEYEQSIIRLGLEKAKAEGDLDRVKKEVAEIAGRYAIIIKDIDEAQENLEKIKTEISDTINKGLKEVGDISKNRQESGEKKSEEKKELESLENYLSSIKGEIEIIEASLKSVSETVEKKRTELSKIKDELSEKELEKKTVEAEIVSLLEIKEGSSEKIEEGEKVLAYISLKEQFLNRKEADLIKYEKRVEKMRQDTNNNNQMKFE